ncbi:MAG: hypothetical protein BGO63_08605 [Candidatus Accumulibacter sp. 66-26]|nr:MAG: hypothetical protein BGO63_08605 [Candidatus Accumulibacter sp. 66-26]
MPRLRTFLIGAVVAAAALAAGIYAGLRQEAQNQAPDITPEHVARLFATQLDDPTGKPQPFAQWQGKTLVVNFWATWCPPCREEMPAFSRMQSKYAANGVQFVGIALDNADSVRDYARQFPVSYPLLIGGPDGGELARQLGNARLALPYTLLLDPSGKPRFARLGALSEQELAQELTKLGTEAPPLR